MHSRPEKGDDKGQQHRKPCAPDYEKTSAEDAFRAGATAQGAAFQGNTGCQQRTDQAQRSERARK
jgi:hypothetical protein